MDCLNFLLSFAQHPSSNTDVADKAEIFRFSGINKDEILILINQWSHKFSLLLIKVS